MTFGGLENGLEIDLGHFKSGHFKSVQVDAQANTLTIGGSVTFAEIVDPLYNVGKEIRELRLNTFG